MARSYVARKLVQLGGAPEWRQGFVTDNGNWILDVYNLELTDSKEFEVQIDSIAGVVSNGIFSRRPADKIIVGSESKIRRFSFIFRFFIFIINQGQSAKIDPTSKRSHIGTASITCEIISGGVRSMPREKAPTII